MPSKVQSQHWSSSLLTLSSVYSAISQPPTLSVLLLAAISPISSWPLTVVVPTPSHSSEFSLPRSPMTSLYAVFDDDDCIVLYNFTIPFNPNSHLLLWSLLFTFFTSSSSFSCLLNLDFIYVYSPWAISPLPVASTPISGQVTLYSDLSCKMKFQSTPVRCHHRDFPLVLLTQ